MENLQQNLPERNVVFESEGFKSNPRITQSSSPKILGWIIKCSGGLVTTESAAMYIVLGFVTLALLVSAFIFMNGGTSGPRATSASLQQQKQFMNTVPPPGH